VFIDIESLLRLVYRARHTRRVLRTHQNRGQTDPRQRALLTTIITNRAAAVIAGMRLRAGKAGAAKSAGRMVVHAIVTARTAELDGVANRRTTRNK
jgi:hypothetical protein